MQIIYLVFVCLLNFAKPGEPVATLTCKSKSQMVFKADIPQMKYLETAELIQNGKKVEFANTDSFTVVFSASQKTFHLTLKNSSYKINLTASPSSFKTILNKKGPGTEFHRIYEFSAVLNVSSKQENNSVALHCVLDYEL